MEEILGKIGFDWQVAVVNLVGFLIIYWLLAKYAFGPISSAIKKRQAVIDKGLEDATKAETELQMAKQKADGIEKTARSEANTLLVKAKENGDKIIESAKQEAENEKTNILDNAKKQIAQKEAESEQKLREKTANLVVSGIETILKDSINIESNEAIAKKALAKF